MIETGYTPCAIVQWGNDRDVKLWMGHPEESCKRALLTLIYLIEEQHADPLLLWVCTHVETKWLRRYADMSWKQTKSTEEIIAELKELAARWVDTDGESVE